jgi:cytochrome P450
MAEVAEIDDSLTSPAAFARLDHYVALRRLRAEAPVHWTVGNAVRPFWSVTRHADCVRVLTDAATFSSDLGGSA